MAKELTVLLVGDLNCDQPEPYSMLANVAGALRLGDFTLGNLEGPICDPGQHSLEKAEYMSFSCLRAPVPTAQALRQTGFSAVNMANNHMMDFGVKGLLQTLELLDRVGIRHAGGGRNLDEARRPVFLEKSGVRLAFLGFTAIYTPMDFPAREDKPGVVCVRVMTAYQVPRNLAYSPGVWPRSVTITDPKDKEWVLDDVRKAKQQADVVVVSWHWGISGRQSAVGMDLPDDIGPSWVVDYQKEMGRAVIDAGATLVMGHHPARLQGMERYKGGLICYSLGNFAFGHWSSAHRMESCIVKGYIDPQRKQFTRFSFIPVRLEDKPLEIPHLTGTKDGKDVIEVVKLHSREYGTQFQIEDDEVFINPPGSISE